MNEAQRLRRLDLQDLMVFLAVMDGGSAREAAERLSVSPSTISYSLKRLRDSFQDPLFVLHQGRLQANARARQLHPYLKAALDSIAQGGARPSPDDAQPQRWRLVAPEYGELLILPWLAHQGLGTAGPEGAVHMERLGAELPVERMLAGDLDLALVAGPGHHRMDPQLPWHTLWQDDFVCLAPNPGRSQRLSLDDYCQARHAYPAPWMSSHNIIDDWLRRLGRKRHIVLQCPSYQACVQQAALYGLVLALPRRLLAHIQRPPSLEVLEPPPGCPVFTIDMVWAPTAPAATQARQQALRQSLLQLAALLDTPKSAE